MNGPFGVAELAVFTGLLFVMGALSVILVIVLTQLRNRRVRAEMFHKERLLAIEKGILLPPDYLEALKKRRPYVAGLVWTGIGLGFMLWGIIGNDFDIVGWGLPPFFIGIALLIGDFVTGKRELRPKNGSAGYREAPAPYRPPDNPS